LSNKGLSTTPCEPLKSPGPLILPVPRQARDLWV
jgi:hypothetical protein